MLVHRGAVEGIAKRCRAQGKPVIAGGPLFTASPHLFPDIAHRVLGEAEELMPQLVEDLRRGEVKASYRAATRPAMHSVPVPRWDLVELKHYVTMAVQFSRGCPYMKKAFSFMLRQSRKKMILRLFFFPVRPELEKPRSLKTPNQKSMYR